jgi:membrane protein CcdC involved in cytochrome C biogenesis
MFPFDAILYSTQNVLALAHMLIQREVVPHLSASERPAARLCIFLPMLFFTSSCLPLRYPCLRSDRLYIIPFLACLVLSSHLIHLARMVEGREQF